MNSSMERRNNLRARWSITIIRRMPIAKRLFASAGIGALIALLICGTLARSQTKSALVYGNLYRVHAGFLELKGGKNITVVKIDAATIYWDGKADKAAAKKDLVAGDEIIAEMAEKDGVVVAKKIRFLHRGT